MTDIDDVDERLRAVERALTDGETAPVDLEEAAALADRLATVEDRLEDVADRLTECEAETRAVRGYVGNVRAVGRDVERRADAALATAEELEERLADREDPSTADPTGQGPGRASDGSATAPAADRTGSGEEPTAHQEGTPRHADRVARRSVGGTGDRPTGGGSDPCAQDRARDDAEGRRDGEPPEEGAGEGLLADLRDRL